MPAPAIELELAAIDAFAAVAREFCESVRGASERSVDARSLAKMIARLIECGLELPTEFADGPEPPRIHHDIQVDLSLDIYFDVFDPLALPPEEAAANSLFDDLADIHADLARGLALYDEGHIRTAGWEWVFHFWNHWGEHATGALRALYWLMRNTDNPT